MRVTRSSTTSIATSVKRRLKAIQKSDKFAAKPKPSLPNKRSDARGAKKRKCKSLPANLQSADDDDEVSRDDEDDILSVHSEDGNNEFSFNCGKCNKKFQRRSYLAMHFNLAHNIDLGLDKKKEDCEKMAPDCVDLDVDVDDKSPPNIKPKTDEMKEKEMRYKKNDLDMLKIEDEDYYSCDSITLDSEMCSEEWNDSDLDVESIFDEFLKCSHCDSTFDHQLLLDNHVCLMRNLSPEHRDIVKNQPFVELKRLRGQSKKKNRRKLMFAHACPLCNLRFANKMDMVIHAQNEHRVDPNLMKFATNNGQNGSDKFLASSKNGVYQRDCVRKSKGRKSDLNEMASEKLVCPVCCKTFSTRNKMEAHTEKEHLEKGTGRPKKYDHNTDPLAKALTKRHRLGRGEPKNRVCSLFRMMGLTLQKDPSKYV